MKKTRNNKLFSLLLALLMVISVIPMGIMSSSAAETYNYTLYIYGNHCYKDSVLTMEISLSDFGINASGNDNDGYVYEFNNVNFVTTSYTAIKFENDATINLVGENTVKCENNSLNTTGIHGGNLTIQGEGSLIVTAGNSGYTFSNGITCSDLIINGGKISITSGNSAYKSRGINCINFTMTNGKVETKSGNVNGSEESTCSGIYCADFFLMEGGNLNCVGGNAISTGFDCSAESYGMKIPGYIVVHGGKITASCGTSSGVVLSNYAAVYSMCPPDCKAVDTGDSAELSYSNAIYNKSGNPAANATLTAKPKDYTLYISGTKGYKDSDFSMPITLSLLGITASEPTTGVFEYTFNDVNFETTAAMAISFANDATINLVGTNIVKAGDDSTDLTTYGIYSMDEAVLTIQGEGSLTVVAGNTVNPASYGIMVDNLEIKGGNLKVASGNADAWSYGIVCKCFNIKKGNLDITAGNANYISYGIEIDILSMTGGTMNCISGTVTEGTSAAAHLGEVFTTKAVDTDTKAELTYDPQSKYYIKDTTIVKKATFTTTNICEYNSTIYPSIAKALEAIGEGTQDLYKKGTIKLLADNKEDVTISQYQDITLDLNGFTLESSVDTTITNYGKLSVIDSSTDKTGKILTVYRGIYNKSSGILTVEDVKITANEKIVTGIYNSGICTIKGDKTEISCTTTGIAAAVENYNTITIKAGKFTASGSGDFTVAFASSTDKVTINDDAEFIIGESTATMKCAYFSSENNTISAGKFNGPISFRSGKTLSVTGGSFTVNPKDFVDSDNYKVVENASTAAYKYTVIEKTTKSISAPATITKKYDGSALNGEAVPQVTSGTTVTYQTKTTQAGQYSDSSENIPSITDAGVLYVKATAKNNDYKTVSVEYTLTVTKRDVTLTSASDSKKYDGTPLTNSYVTVSGDGFASEDGAIWNVTGSQTEVGVSENTFTYSLNPGTNPANYNIDTVNGALSVILCDEDRFNDYKTDLITYLETVNNEHDSIYSTKALDEAKSTVSNYTYDESKSYEENIAFIEAVRDTAVNKVMTRHNFIFNCPFMSFIAKIMEPVIKFINSQFAK